MSELYKNPIREPNSYRTANILLFFTMVLIMLAFGVIIPVFPFIIENMVGIANAGHLMGLLVSLFAIMQLIFSPMWGEISDRIGRKPLLVLATLGNAVTLVIFAVATQVWMLIVARIISGFLTAAFFPAAMAYISDITTIEQRSRGMGRIGAAMGIGMILGPAIGGVFPTIQAPFYFVAGLSIIGAFAIFLFLPESLSVEDRISEVHIDIVSQFVRMVKGLRSPIGFLLVLTTLVALGLTNFEAIFALYSAFKYSYDHQQIGIMLTLVGVISAISQGILIGKATDLFGEIGLIKLSIAGNIIGFLLMGLATLQYPITIYLSVGFFVLSNSMMRPSIASLVSKNADVPQGIAQGLNNSFMSLGRILGPLSAGFLFDINIEYPYYAGAFILLIGFILSIFYLTESKMLVRSPVKSYIQYAD